MGKGEGREGQDLLPSQRWIRYPSAAKHVGRSAGWQSMASASALHSLTPSPGQYLVRATKDATWLITASM